MTSIERRAAARALFRHGITLAITNGIVLLLIRVTDRLEAKRLREKGQTR